MKKAIIIYNEGAGFGKSCPDDLKESLKKEGFEIRMCSLKGENFPEILEEDAQLVVVAGGDGTVKTVAMHMAGREMPCYIWPMGTSNNIATTFGFQKGSLNLADKTLRKLNIAQFQNGKKEIHFIESAGVGLLSGMMRKMIKEVNYTNKQEKINKSLEILLEALKEPNELEIQLFLDGERYDDKYLAVEIMNISYAGPRLFLAPEADPGDGYFDVVLISQKQRNEFEEYLKDRLSGVQRPPHLPVYKAKEIKIVGRSLHLHVDDEILFADEPNEFFFSQKEERTMVLAPNKEE